jgi:hypothetical protein
VLLVLLVWCYAYWHRCGAAGAASVLLVHLLFGAY